MPITKMGKVLVLVIMALLFAGLNTRSNLMHLFNTFLVSIWLLSPLLAQKNAQDIKVKVHTPAEVFVNDVFSVRLLFDNDSPNDKYSLLFKDKKKSVFIAHLPPFSHSISSYEMSCSKRGVISWKKIELTTTYPFDFFYHKVKLTVEHTLYVLPPILTVQNLPYSSQSAHAHQTLVTNNKLAQDEFSMLREYIRGDNPRHIDWKATAKKNELIVKEYVALEPIESSIILAFSGLDIDSFEEMIKVTASIVADIHRRGKVSFFSVGEKSLFSKKIAQSDILRLLALATMEKSHFVRPEKFHKNIYIITNKIDRDVRDYVCECTNVTFIYPNAKCHDKETQHKQYSYSIHNNIIDMVKI